MERLTSGSKVKSARRTLGTGSPSGTPPWWCSVITILIGPSWAFMQRCAKTHNDRAHSGRAKNARNESKTSARHRVQHAGSAFGSRFKLLHSAKLCSAHQTESGIEVRK